MIASILFISFAILLFLGAPIAVCLGSSSILAMLVQVPSTVVSRTSTFALRRATPWLSLSAPTMHSTVC